MTPLLAFAVDPLPIGEMLPPGRHAADFGLAAVRQDDEGVVPEQLRDRLLVVLQVVLVGVFEPSVALLEFDEDQRQAVDEADQIAASLVDVARHPELRSQEEVVVRSAPSSR